MKKLIFLLTAVLFVSFIHAQSHKLSENLKDLKPFVNKTWVGEFTSPEGKKMRDVSKWEITLKGMAVRITHSLNEGEYGGETILYYDKNSGKITFNYFTTAGFKTSGTFEYINSEYVGLEEVKGNQDGITEVKSISKFIDENSFEIISQYLQNGKWVEGHQIEYKLDNSAKVIFK